MMKTMDEIIGEIAKKELEIERLEKQLKEAKKEKVKLLHELQRTEEFRRKCREARLSPKEAMWELYHDIRAFIERRKQELEVSE